MKPEVLGALLHAWPVLSLGLQGALKTSYWSRRPKKNLGFWVEYFLFVCGCCAESMLKRRCAEGESKTESARKARHDPLSV